LPVILVNKVVDPKRIIRKMGAEEEERHKGSLTKKTMQFKSRIHLSVATLSLKPYIPWRDSNPGLQFMRRMRCPLLHSDRAFGSNFLHLEMIFF
jgi:hypothetical protein